MTQRRVDCVALELDDGWKVQTMWCGESPTLEIVHRNLRRAKRALRAALAEFSCAPKWVEEP